MQNNPPTDPIFAHCPGCGHRYGLASTLSTKSTPNENGYCGWCVDEGVASKESEQAADAKADRVYCVRQAKEQAEIDALYGE